MENNLQLGVEEKPWEGVELAGFGMLLGFGVFFVCLFLVVTLFLTVPFTRASTWMWCIFFSVLQSSCTSFCFGSLLFWFPLGIQ